MATGTARSVRDFVRFSFEAAGPHWEKQVRFDERYLRPTEVDALMGDASRARNLLWWMPTVLTPELARIMVDADPQQLADALSDAAAKRARQSPLLAPCMARVLMVAIAGVDPRRLRRRSVKSSSVPGGQP